jgi:hypothetical protein
VRKYLIEAKTTEGRTAIAALASGIAQCTTGATLPPTSRAVPPSLESVRGMKYQSVPAEWQEQAYACARFRLADPQYFQYQWVRIAPTVGAVRALADLDGDGVPDVSLEQKVSCSGPGVCAVDSK